MAELETLRRKLQARQNKPGFAANVGAIQARIYALAPPERVGDGKFPRSGRPQTDVREFVAALDTPPEAA